MPIALASADPALRIRAAAPWGATNVFQPSGNEDQSLSPWSALAHASSLHRVAHGGIKGTVAVYSAGIALPFGARRPGPLGWRHRGGRHSYPVEFARSCCPNVRQASGDASFGSRRGDLCRGSRSHIISLSPLSPVRSGVRAFTAKAH